MTKIPYKKSRNYINLALSFFWITYSISGVVFYSGKTRDFIALAIGVAYLIYFIFDKKEYSIIFDKNTIKIQALISKKLDLDKLLKIETSENNLTLISDKNDISIDTTLIDNKNLRIECGSDINFNGRPGALKRSFQNVIQNGLTYGKSVNVKVQKSNNRVIVLIEDDGPGIPEDQYKNVFKPFFRLDKSRSLNKSGVGLGLAIVEDVINSHGGNIQMGKSKMMGLSVKISLPY